VRACIRRHIRSGGWVVGYLLVASSSCVSTSARCSSRHGTHQGTVL
jgi:hypothetical protein